MSKNDRAESPELQSPVFTAEEELELKADMEASSNLSSNDIDAKSTDAMALLESANRQLRESSLVLAGLPFQRLDKLSSQDLERFREARRLEFRALTALVGSQLPGTHMITSNLAA